MGDCFICQKPLIGDIYVAKTRAVQTLLAASVKRGCVEHQHMLQNIDSVSVHKACYKNYGNDRLASLASRRSTSIEREPEVQPQLIPNFDFANRCLFCGEVFRDESKLPTHRRKKVQSVKERSTKESILRYLSGRDDAFATSIVERVQSIPDLVAVEARYHLECIHRVYHFVPEERIVHRPSGDKINEAMQGVYSFLQENSEECQFSMTELMNQIKGDFVPHIKTVKVHLKNKYGDDILINEKQGRDSIVCFRNTGFKILSEKWYDEKKKDYREERLRVIREAAAIIREDIRGVVYDKNNYPPSDAFVKDVEAAVPESLEVLLSSIITKDKRGALEHWKKKCTAIAHAIITSVRPRSFLSPLQIGVGTFLYKKFGSKSLINILSAMGFSASYREVTIFENSCIHRAETKIGKNSFSQYVFDNADFNINTLDGHGTFHAMGGIHCVTPLRSIQRESEIPRIVEIKSASEVAQLGMVPVVSYSKHKLAGLQTITVADLITLRQLSSDILPTVPDLIWLYGKWSCSAVVPGWNGFMESVTANMNYDRSKVICLPFINAPPSDYDTILTSLLEAVENSKRHNQNSTFVTFDQPLYWKARDIVAAAEPTSDLKNVVVRLGGFHLLMSFMGTIGMIMSGSGIEELFKLIYAENCVEKILSGHAYARAIRAHILSHTALTKIVLDTLEFDENERDELDNYVEDIFNRPAIVTVAENNGLKSVYDKFAKELNAIENRGPTAKLWVQYHRMVSLVKNFLEAERSGKWELHLDTIQKMLPYFHASGHFLYAKSAHLYLQDMQTLEEKIPIVEDYFKFTRRGYFTIRRTDKFWSGIMSDMTIEQTLMRSMKTTGGLTQGRGIKDSTIASWTLGMVQLQNICEQIEDFSGVSCCTTEQHVDMRPSRITRDNRDLEKLDMWLADHNPFPENKELMSIGTGVIANQNINCHRAYEIGCDMITNIVGATFGSLSFKRKDKVLPISAVNTSIKIDASPVPINPLLLFQRMCIAKNSETDLKHFLAYELAPFPLSLFTEEGMRKGTKSLLYNAFEPLTKDLQPGDRHHYVIDGGFLLHKVVWGRIETFDLICQKYVTYVQRHFGENVTIIFDGYPNDMRHAGTKTSERVRRSRKNQSPEFKFDESTTPKVSQEKFLARDQNKDNFIKMLFRYFTTTTIKVEQAFEDADIHIVTTAIKAASIYDSVKVIGEDVDLLVLIAGLAQDKPNIYFRKPAKGSTPAKLYCPSSFKHEKSVLENILFIHAFSGCDTTSSFYNIGKSKFIKTLEKHPDLRSSVELFKEEKVDQEVLTCAGEQFLIALYDGNKKEKSINILRFNRFAKSMATNKSNHLLLLPPTKSAVRQHIFRTYLQVQTWLGIYKDPEEWGWRATNYGLEPVKSTAEPAPPELLKLISCKCKGSCDAACGCRKAGINCSVICFHCSGQTCNNVAKIDIVFDDDNDEDDENDNSSTIQPVFPTSQESPQLEEYIEEEHLQAGPSKRRKI